MDGTLSDLIERLDTARAVASRVISWSCPVPVFGNLGKSLVATLGLNPSNREFVDDTGVELDGPSRRLPTLKSLELDRWSDATAEHLEQIGGACRDYFSRNPYHGWFRSLDAILSGGGCSYYGVRANACHLDLIPYATECKWSELTARQRSTLIAFAGDVLAYLLRDAPVRLLLLNGRAVVENLQSVAGVTLDRVGMRSWTLPRRSRGVAGYAFRGTITRLAGIDLGRPIMTLGYNHNIQSSFGVTAKVKCEIRRWFAAVTKEVSLWDPPTEQTDNASMTCWPNSTPTAIRCPASKMPATGMRT
jgi:hypothetical protein